jgi:hypothetical protein
MNIDVRSNIAEVTKNLTNIQRKQIPFATSKTLNELAFDISRKAMPQNADRKFKGGATRFTKQGFKYKKSSKNFLVAEVFVDDIQVEYMKYMVEGGTRFPKKRAIVVPTSKMRLNKFGNMKEGQVKKILADKDKYFSGVPKGHPGAPAGIWERYGRRGGRAKRIRPVALYTDSAGYMPLFPFAQIGKSVVFARSNGFTDRFRKNLLKALATAKG